MASRRLSPPTSTGFHADPAEVQSGRTAFPPVSNRWQHALRGDLPRLAAALNAAAAECVGPLTNRRSRSWPSRREHFHTERLGDQTRWIQGRHRSADLIGEGVDALAQ